MDKVYSLETHYDESELCNRIRVKYTQIDTYVMPIQIISEAFTDWAEDIESQKKYGIQEKTVVAMNVTKEQAEMIRDAYLEYYKNPIPIYRFEFCYDR